MSLRRERVADQIRDVVSRRLQGGRMDDPRLQGVVITFAKVSSDLQVCTIYFRYTNDAIEVTDVLKGLESASGHFRALMARSLGLRRVPQLRFFFDESIENASRIEHLISQL